jgi:hypothetical protein
MPGKNYVGKAGQLAVMAEFLLRGYNVAMPEVDVGDDIFVVADRTGRLWRIQVKTAIGKKRGYGYSGKFAIRAAQLEEAKVPDLFYVFALRAAERWEFLVVSRAKLMQEQENYYVASRGGRNLIFTFRFQPSAVMCSRRDFQHCRNHWPDWPLIEE